jgi:phosphohistidine phosphatase
MTLRLIITRHAKAEPADAAAEDHARPLAPRGVADARRLGAWLAREGAHPALVLCSDARRTRDTWAAIRTGMEDAAPGEAARGATAPLLRESRALYHAAPEQIAQALAAAGSTSPVLIVGHNPGIGALAAMLLSDPPHDPDFARYPTAATTIIDFDARDWREAAAQTGRLAAFVHPRAPG